RAKSLRSNLLEAEKGIQCRVEAVQRKVKQYESNEKLKAMRERESQMFLRKRTVPENDVSGSKRQKMKSSNLEDGENFISLAVTEDDNNHMAIKDMSLEEEKQTVKNVDLEALWTRKSVVQIDGQTWVPSLALLPSHIKDNTYGWWCINES